MQMETDARASSDKRLHIYLYTNKAGCVGGRLSRSHINTVRSVRRKARTRWQLQRR